MLARQSIAFLERFLVHLAGPPVSLTDISRRERSARKNTSPLSCFFFVGLFHMRILDHQHISQSAQACPSCRSGGLCKGDIYLHVCIFFSFAQSCISECGAPSAFVSFPLAAYIYLRTRRAAPTNRMPPHSLLWCCDTR